MTTTGTPTTGTTGTTSTGETTGPGTGTGTDGTTDLTTDLTTDTTGTTGTGETTGPGTGTGTDGTTDLTTDTGSSSTGTTDTTETSSTGEPVLCGNAMLDDGEACDDGLNDGAYGGCAPDCSALGPNCGDSNINGPETCDDGNDIDDDACTNACALASCGDGIKQADEACDDANDVETDACLATCVDAKCGDTFVQEGVEACDDGNPVETDACLATCVAAKCGDNFVQEGVEVCDDGVNNNAYGGCAVDCKAKGPFCGDKVKNGAEECDDGNMVDNDMCSNTCKAVVCDIDTPAATGPELLTAASFAVLAGSTVTNTGGTVLEGDLGVSPGTAIVGFPPGVVIGTTHANDAVAGQAQTDLTAAYNDAAGRGGATPLPADISGMVLAPGVYSAETSLQIASADLTLDGGGDPNATWIFQIGSTLVTSSGADVIMTDDGCSSAENVFWQVGSSATIGTGTDFVGTVMADQSITATSGSTVEGRLLARVGAVTLDTNLVSVP